MSEVEFIRDAFREEPDRCSRCGATVTEEGQARHREWHSGLTDLLEALRIAIMIGG